MYYINWFLKHNKLNINGINKSNFNCVINYNLPPSKVISLIRNNSKRGLNHSLNKVNLQYYSTNTSNAENNKPILINSKEILNNYIFEGITVISITYLASKWKGALDTTAKVVVIAAGSTILYNSWFQRSASSSSSNNNDENKKDKDNKQISKNQVTNDKKQKKIM